MPSSAALPPFPSFRRQHLNVDFASLRAANLHGVFVSTTPGDPSLWVGVLFVRRGPYAPAVLRFHISFPPTYPALPPLVTFSSDVFHPLLTPLTTYTYTYTTGSSDSDTVSASDDERLPPGGFSLRHGFPHWFRRAQPSAPTSRDVSGSTVSSSTARHAANPAPAEDVSIVKILDYIRSAFSDESLLDSLPLEAAANPGAYHAWQTYRAPPPSTESTPTDLTDSGTLGRNRRPGEWNWEGVWEERVKKAVKASLSEPVLFGPEDIIRFRDNEDEVTERMRRQLEATTLNTTPA
ncbi:hypothetical protein ACEQ8H_003249 [Pleosporales sp. CAS-2024a]